jgi:hypothetical protein
LWLSFIGREKARSPIRASARLKPL